MNFESLLTIQCLFVVTRLPLQTVENLSAAIHVSVTYMDLCNTKSISNELILRRNYIATTLVHCHMHIPKYHYISSCF